jgi:ABC-type transport system substrate-binding protein
MMIKITKNLRVFTIFFVFVFLILTACTPKEKLQFGDLDVFRYNEHKNINSLDPAFAKDLADIWGVHQLFNGLVQMDSLLQVQPAIAKSWVIGDSAKVYTFHLRSDVYFHQHPAFGKDSTRLVNALDFEYSFKRLLDPKLASPGSWVLQKVKSITAVSNRVLRIELEQPFPAFLGLLTMKYCSVVPREVVELYGSEFRSNPIGTGPFKFKRWEENIKLVFRKNHRYFERDENNVQLPYLESIAITFLPDKQSEFLQFAQGNIDFVSGLDASYKDEILNEIGELKESYENSVSMIRGPYLNTEYLSFYMDSELPEIQSLKLRKAIAIGFDRERMITFLRNGIGIPADGGFIPKGLPGYRKSSCFEYNPELAQQLIAEFKRETGLTDPGIVLTTTSNYLSFCEFIQREIEKIGLDLEIEILPASSLKDAKANGKLPFFRASWVADYPDAENYLSLFYSPNFAPEGPNYSHFSDSEFDRLYEQSYLLSDSNDRKSLYSKMDSLAMKMYPVVPLFYDEVVRFTQKGVSGLGINPINLLELKAVRKSP